MDFFYSPGFGGACALLAGIVAFFAAQRSTRQRRATDEARLAQAALRREDELRSDAIQRAWDRFVWLMQQSDSIDDRLTARMLRRITQTAGELDDPDLVEFSQQFALELFDRQPSEPDPQPASQMAGAEDDGGGL